VVFARYSQGDTAAGANADDLVLGIRECPASEVIAAEHEHECAMLASDAAEFIVGKLAATKGLGFRGTTALENEIYGWLYEHAIFDD
jgi:hypothetical protein